MSTHDNRFNSQQLVLDTAERAKACLAMKGINYPTYDSKLSPSENYERIDAYRLQESTLIAQYLKEFGSRPLVDPVALNKQQFAKPYKDWYD